MQPWSSEIAGHDPLSASSGKPPVDFAPVSGKLLSPGSAVLHEFRFIITVSLLLIKKKKECIGMSVHEGHRERLRDNFLTHGLDGFHELQALELLLFYAIPRRDTNPLAHALLEHFGSLDGVFSASERELCEVPGVGKNTAALILLIPQILKRSRVAAADEIKYIRCGRDAALYLRPRLDTEKEEVALMICLDAQMAVINCLELARGTINAVDFNIRRVIEHAMKSKACYVILAHNHPGGSPRMSREDDAVTGRLYKALDLVGIHLYDHIIVAGGEYSSIRDMGGMRLYSF